MSCGEQAKREEARLSDIKRAYAQNEELASFLYYTSVMQISIKPVTAARACLLVCRPFANARRPCRIPALTGDVPPRRRAGCQGVGVFAVVNQMEE